MRVCIFTDKENCNFHYQLLFACDCDDCQNRCICPTLNVIALLMFIYFLLFQHLYLGIFSTFVRRNIFKCTSFRLKHFQIISFAEILLSKFYLKFETIMHGRKESLHTLFRIRTSKLNAIN